MAHLRIMDNSTKKLLEKVDTNVMPLKGSTVISGEIKYEIVEVEHYFKLDPRDGEHWSIHTLYVEKYTGGNSHEKE